MRVLYLTNIPSPYRVNFFNDLGERCDLTVLFERKGALNRNENWFNNQSYHFKAIFLKGPRISEDSAFCPSVIRKMRRHMFDIIVIGGYSTFTGMMAIEALRLRKIPFILSCDGGFIKEDSRIKMAIKRHFIRSASWWLSTGKETNRYLEHYGAKPANTYVYPFSSLRYTEILKDLPRSAEKESLRKQLGIPGHRVVLGVGQFISRKGFDIAIKAWKAMSNDVTLVLIGGGPEYEKYQQLVNDNNLSNVRIEDFKKKEHLKWYYLAADLFLMPTREDIWGLVINEAMACGLPVLSTDTSLAAKELVKNGVNGWLIPAEDAGALSSRLQDILNNEESLRAMGRESLKAIKPYTIENMTEEHMRIFNEIYAAGKEKG